MKKKYIVFVVFIIIIYAIQFKTQVKAQDCNRPSRTNSLPYPKVKQNNAIRVISYNIRKDYKIDVTHNNSWDKRKHSVKKIINYYDPDIIGLQEALKSQKSELELLFPEYIIINDVPYESEIYCDSMLLYKKERFDLIDSSYFWLSESILDLQNIPKDFKFPQIALFMKLHDKLTGKIFFVYTVHFDSRTSKSRFEGANVIRQKEKNISKDFPVAIFGDLNTFGNTAQSIYKKFIIDKLFQDIRDSDSKHFGPDGTWIGWPYDDFAISPENVGDRLDHMFVKNMQVLQEGVLRDKIDDSDGSIIFQAYKNNILNTKTLYPSDHLPIIADLIVN